MKPRIPRRCWLGVSLIASIVSAQTPPASPVITEEAQKFLNAPVWYFNYTVTIKFNRSQTSSLGGSRTESSERVMNGRMLLGLRSQGPSLSIATGDARPPDLISQTAAQQAQALAGLGANADPQAVLAAVTQQLGSVTSAQVDQAAAQLDAFIENYANWISGVNLDETKSDAENEQILIRVREQNGKAFERYRWEFTASGSAGGHDRGAANGSGAVLNYGEPAFEIDGANQKFKLLFNLFFNDTVQTLEALRGQTEHNIGTIHYQRFEIKTGLHSGEQPLGDLRPAYGMIEGRLPSSFGNISGQSLHSIVGSDGAVVGSLSVQYVLSPNPPVPAELWIDPPVNYQQWLPNAEEDERTAGDVVPIKIVLQKPGGGAPQFKPVRYEFFLLDTSREKGVCLNWPPPPAPGTPGANDPPPYDLQFESAKNPDMFVSDEGLRLVETVPTLLEREVVVSCFDYGAYGEFAVHAVLENGQLVEGIVRGTTDQKTLKLPARKDGSKIATAFLDNNGVSNLADDDDSENDPVGDRFKGDGLALYEEYRGFKHGTEWIPGDPKKKDVFVLNEVWTSYGVLMGIKAFEQMTGLNVHNRLLENQVNADHAINFSRTSAPHVVDQHVIWIKPGLSIAQGSTAASVVAVGTPGTAKSVQVPPDLGSRAGAAYFASTVAHEMLHCCNVYHHGERDRNFSWYYRPGEGQVYEVGFGTGAGNPVPITIKKEDGTVVPPSTFFPPGETRMTVSLGLKHGQHSGREDCVMRYDCAIAYPSSRDPNVRYLTNGETTGLNLCRSAAGTGVNAPGHSPESRYETAATPQNGGLRSNGDHIIINDRGNCYAQVRVNDKDREPKR